MICTKCNKHNDESHRFCKICGNELNIHTNNTEIEIISVVTYEEKQKKNAKNRRIAIWFMVSIIIVLTIMTIISFKNPKSDRINDIDSLQLTAIPETKILDYTNLEEQIGFSIVGQDNLFIETNQSFVDIDIQTLRNVLVKFNNKPILIDADGLGNVVLDDLLEGINHYKVTLSLEGYVSNIYDVYVNYTKAIIEIPLTIERTTVLDAEKGIILIEGSTIKNINMSCNYGFYMSPSIDDNGGYKAQIKLPDAIKDYNVEIIVTDSDGNISIEKTIIPRKFYEDVYYANAIEVKGKDFVLDAAMYDNKVLIIQGDIIDSTKVNDQLYKIELIPFGTNNTSILIYYYGESRLRADTNRKFYCQYMGEEDGKIIVHAYLAYK